MNPIDHNPRLTDLARELCLAEHGRRQVDIADMHETIACLGRLLRRRGLVQAAVLFCSIYRRAGTRPS
jgi:hypothetical protein